MEYPKWKYIIPSHPTEDEFKKSWKHLFRFDYENCKIEYGKQKLGDNNLGSGLNILTPDCSYMYGNFKKYTANPILHAGQGFYYPGSGITWGIDSLHQYFCLIDPKMGLPVYWDEVYNWEIIKNYEPFLTQLFK